MMSTVGLVAVLALIVFSSATTIGDFQKVTSTGVSDAWKTADPQNVEGSFGTIYGNDRVYLISKRLYRKLSSPFDPASRGGIVSTYHISNGSWTHKPYDRLDDDQFGDKLFWMGGRLFMLTYSEQERIGFHKLFYWDDESGQWFETPFEIDPAASTITASSWVDLSLNVPDPDGSTAYLVASAPQIFGRGSELAFSRLDVEFRDNVPIKASLKPLGHFKTKAIWSVVFTALNNGKLYALVHAYYSDGPVPIKDKIIALNLQSNIAYVLNLGGDHPPMDFSRSDRIFQFKDQVFLVGGSRIVGLGETKEVKNIWSLDLSSLRWKGTSSSIPAGLGSGFALDQKNGKLHAAGLGEGISVATVSDK